MAQSYDKDSKVILCSTDSCRNVAIGSLIGRDESIFWCAEHHIFKDQPSAKIVYKPNKE